MPERLVCVLLVGLGLAACGSEPSSSVDVGTPTPTDHSVSADSTTAATDALAGIEWQLVVMVISGRTVSAESVDAVLRFDGVGGYSANACNFQGGTAEIGAGTLVLGPGGSTEAFCAGLGGEIDDALGSLSDSTVTWTVADSELVLAGAAGTTLRYRVRSSIHPDAEARDVVAGERDGWQYRLSVTSDGGKLSGMGFETRSGPGVAWGQHGVGAPSPGESPLWTIIASDVAGERFIAGFAPIIAVSATHQATSSAPPVSLEIFDVDDTQWAMIGGFVPEHSPDSVILVHDGAGTVIAEWRHA